MSAVHGAHGHISFEASIATFFLGPDQGMKYGLGQTGSSCRVKKSEVYESVNSKTIHCVC